MLFKKVQSGDKEALDKFVTCNSRFVYFTALHYARKLNPDSKYKAEQLAEDLFQDGIPGLYKAINKFKPERGNRFWTFACYYVKKAIQRSFRKYSQIAITAHEDIFRFSKSRYLNQPISREDESQLYSIVEDSTFLSPFDIVSNKEEYNKLEEEVLKLKPKHRKIIQLIFLSEKDYTLKQIAQELGISTQALDMAKKKALKRLRYAIPD